MSRLGDDSISVHGDSRTVPIENPFVEETIGPSNRKTHRLIDESSNESLLLNYKVSERSNEGENDIGEEEGNASANALSNSNPSDIRNEYEIEHGRNIHAEFRSEKTYFIPKIDFDVVPYMPDLMFNTYCIPSASYQIRLSLPGEKTFEK